MAETENLNPQVTGEEEDKDTPMPEAEKPSDAPGAGSDSGSSSDSDSDYEDEAKTKSQIETIEKALLNYPNYDSYVQYIKLLRKIADLEKLRQAREAMSALFPLGPEMWREWAKDEITSSGTEAFPFVEKLYGRGVSDYLSVALWSDYLNFIQEHDPAVLACSVAGISKARYLFESALTAAGLHVTEGHKIWELYREFEEAIFLTIEETDHGSKEKQIQRIRNLFHRQLSVPLAEIRSTLLAYKAWEADHGSTIDVNNSELDGLAPNVVSGYQKALEMLNSRAHLEEKVSKKDADTEKLEEFMTYLKFEHSCGDPTRLQILYERAIAEFPSSSDLWLDYTRYLYQTFKTAKIVRDTYHRATRNCHWVGELWVQYLLSLERGRSSEEDLSMVFEKSLLCTFQTFDEYLNMYLTRIDGLRRRISATMQVEDGLSYTLITDTFQRALNHLSQYLTNTEGLHMFSYWARMELKLGKDLVAARGVWEKLLKICGSMVEAWQYYIAMETEMGHVNEARSLYKRCYCKKFPGTGSEDICHSWVRFEREYGSLEDFDNAVKKVTPRLQELQVLRLKEETKNSVVVAHEEKENSFKKNTREKRKPPSSSLDDQPPAKRHKDRDQKKNQKDVDQKKKPKKDDKSPEVSSVAIEPSESHDNKSEASSSKEMESPTKRSGHFDDECTAFVSNLNFQATEDDIRTFFDDVGGVVAIRILKDKFTKKSRGLAYVDFSDKDHLALAVQKNKQTLLGKRVSVLKSDPNQGRKKNMGPDHEKAEGSRGRGRGRSTQEVQMRRNTFAVPRNVRALGWANNSGNNAETNVENEQGDETPKSNDDFRKMLEKKE